LLTIVLSEKLKKRKVRITGGGASTAERLSSATRSGFGKERKNEKKNGAILELRVLWVKAKKSH